MYSTSFVILFLFVYVVHPFTISKDQYEKSRQLIIQAEEKLMLGGRLELSDKEEKVDMLLKKIKTVEQDVGLRDLSNYPPAMHFFNSKSQIEKSRVFKFIKAMPKGAVLHGHNTAMVSSEWIIKNITYRDGISVCTPNWNNESKVFTFRKKFSECEDDLILLSKLRFNSKNVEKFDKELESLINIWTDTPESTYSNINTVWSKFEEIFIVLGDYLRYKPIFIDFHTKLLQDLYDDNIMYVELRSGISAIFDDTGKEYTQLETAIVLQEVVENFKKSHQNFLGAKIIYSIHRLVEAQTVKRKMDAFKILYAGLPNFIIGFDLIGQEDLGNPLNNFIEELQQLPKGAKFFFHAGETNWYGVPSDLNLLDAILLNTARIGHGYALVKHPILWNAVKARGIALEICPISNQVLKLVQDLRNHPAAFYMSENIPIVISSDDPGFWGAKGLSYDFYYAFMSFAPVDSGLHTLKQLALNSIKYSVLTEDERRLANKMFDERWDLFLDNILSGKYVE